MAYEAGVVCTDESLLHPDPYPNRESWCWARIAATETRLAAIDRAADRAGQSLAAGAAADRRALVSGVRPVLRHRADGGLAHPVQSGRGRRPSKSSR